MNSTFFQHILKLAWTRRITCHGEFSWAKEPGHGHVTAHSAAMQKLRSKPQLGTYAFGTSKFLEVLIFKFVAVCCHFKGGTYGKMRIDQFMEWDTLFSDKPMTPKRPLRPLRPKFLLWFYMGLCKQSCNQRIIPKYIKCDILGDHISNTFHDICIHLDLISPFWAIVPNALLAIPNIKTLGHVRKWISSLYPQIWLAVWKYATYKCMYVLLVP